MRIIHRHKLYWIAGSASGCEHCNAVLDLRVPCVLPHRRCRLVKRSGYRRVTYTAGALRMFAWLLSAELRKPIVP
jgi:hypothetical protein